MSQFDYITDKDFEEIYFGLHGRGLRGDELDNAALALTDELNYKRYKESSPGWLVPKGFLSFMTAGPAAALRGAQAYTPGKGLGLDNLLDAMADRLEDITNPLWLRQTGELSAHGPLIGKGAGRTWQAILGQQGALAVQAAMVKSAAEQVGKVGSGAMLAAAGAGDIAVGGPTGEAALAVPAALAVKKLAGPAAITAYFAELELGTFLQEAEIQGIDREVAEHVMRPLAVLSGFVESLEQMSRLIPFSRAIRRLIGKPANITRGVKSVPLTHRMVLGAARGLGVDLGNSVAEVMQEGLSGYAMRQAVQEMRKKHGEDWQPNYPIDDPDYKRVAIIGAGVSRSFRVTAATISTPIAIRRGMRAIKKLEAMQIERGRALRTAIEEDNARVAEGEESRLRMEDLTAKPEVKIDFRHAGFEDMQRTIMGGLTLAQKRDILRSGILSDAQVRSLCKQVGISLTHKSATGRVVTGDSKGRVYVTRKVPKSRDMLVNQLSGYLGLNEDTTLEGPRRDTDDNVVYNPVQLEQTTRQDRSWLVPLERALYRMARQGAAQSMVNDLPLLKKTLSQSQRSEIQKKAAANLRLKNPATAKKISPEKYQAEVGRLEREALLTKERLDERTADMLFELRANSLLQVEDIDEEMATGTTLNEYAPKSRRGHLKRLATFLRRSQYVQYGTALESELRRWTRETLGREAEAKLDVMIYSKYRPSVVQGSDGKPIILQEPERLPRGSIAFPLNKTRPYFWIMQQIENRTGFKTENFDYGIITQLTRMREASRQIDDARRAAWADVDPAFQRGRRRRLFGDIVFRMSLKDPKEIAWFNSQHPGMSESATEDDYIDRFLSPQTEYTEGGQPFSRFDRLLAKDKKKLAARFDKERVRKQARKLAQDQHSLYDWFFRETGMSWDKYREHYLPLVRTWVESGRDVDWGTHLANNRQLLYKKGLTERDILMFLDMGDMAGGLERRGYKFLTNDPFYKYLRQQDISVKMEEGQIRETNLDNMADLYQRKLLRQVFFMHMVPSIMGSINQISRGVGLVRRDVEKQVLGMRQKAARLRKVAAVIQPRKLGTQLKEAKRLEVEANKLIRMVPSSERTTEILMSYVDSALGIPGHNTRALRASNVLTDTAVLGRAIYKFIGWWNQNYGHVKEFQDWYTWEDVASLMTTTYYAMTLGIVNLERGLNVRSPLKNVSTQGFYPMAVLGAPAYAKGVMKLRDPQHMKWLRSFDFRPEFPLEFRDEMSGRGVVAKMARMALELYRLSDHLNVMIAASTASVAWDRLTEAFKKSPTLEHMNEDEFHKVLFGKADLKSLGVDKREVMDTKGITWADRWTYTGGAAWRGITNELYDRVRNGKAEEAQRMFMQYIVYLTQWRYGRGSTPEMMRNPLGRMFFMFYTWPLNNIEFELMIHNPKNKVFRRAMALHFSHLVVATILTHIGEDQAWRWIWSGGFPDALTFSLPADHINQYLRMLHSGMESVQAGLNPAVSEEAQLRALQEMEDAYRDWRF